MGSNGPAGSALERRTVSPRSSVYLYPSASDLPRGEIRWFLCCVPDLEIIVILVSLLVRHLLGGCGTDRAPSPVSLSPRLRQHWCTVRRSCSRMQKIVRAGEPQFPSVSARKDFLSPRYHDCRALPRPRSQPVGWSRVVRAASDVAKECYLVDPASSHMLVSKIKPCMCKYELIQTVKLRMAH